MKLVKGGLGKVQGMALREKFQGFWELKIRGAGEDLGGKVMGEDRGEYKGDKGAD